MASPTITVAVDVASLPQSITLAVNSVGIASSSTINSQQFSGTIGLSGPKGDTGAKGDKGDTGSTGLTGPANTLTIGTVTSGTAGASITGTAPSQTLNLVLPTATDATPSVKGIMQLTGDLGGTAASPTTPTALHVTGAETAAGIKTFTDTPVFGAPTNLFQLGLAPIPQGTTISSVVAGSSAALSANSTATGTAIVNVGFGAATRVITITATAGSNVVNSASFVSSDAGLPIYSEALVMQQGQGTRGNALQIQSVAQGYGSGNTILTLVPDVNSDPNSGIQTELILYNTTGGNYERLLQSWNGHQYTIAPTRQGTGLDNPIIFQMHGSVSLNAPQANTLLLTRDGSPQLLGATYSDAYGAVDSGALPKGTIIIGVTPGTSAVLSANSNVTGTFDFYLQPSWKNGRIVTASVTSGSNIITGNFLVTDVRDNLAGITITNGGSGYTVGDVLAVVGGTGGTLNVLTVDGSGAVLRVRTSNGGSGYSYNATGTVTGGTGTGFTLSYGASGSPIWGTPTISSVFTTSRTVTDAVTTSGSTTLTSATASFVIGDVGRSIYADGIAVGTYLLAYVSPTQITMSQPATRTATSVPATFGQSWILSNNIPTQSEWPAGNMGRIDFVVNSTGAVSTNAIVTVGANVVVPAAGTTVLPLSGDVGSDVYCQVSSNSSGFRATDPRNTGQSALIIDTMTGSLGTSLTTTSDKAMLKLRRGGSEKWRVGLNPSGANVDSFDIYNTVNSVTGLYVSATGSVRVGASGGNNTTAGDLTATRLSIGNVSMAAGNGSIMAGTGIITDNTSTNIGYGLTTVLNPDSDSSQQYRSLYYSLQTQSGGTANFTNSSNGLVGNFSEVRHQGQGSISLLMGGLFQNVVTNNNFSAANASVITAAYGARVQGIQATNSPTGTVTTAAGIKVIDGTVSSGPLVVTTNVGVDIDSVRIGSTNIGLRIAAPTTGATANYAIQLSDTGGTAAGGITWGTDANLYRSTTSTLKTDGSLNVVGTLTAGTYVGQTSIVTLGTIATGTWSATTIAANKGGTGQTSYADGQLLIGNTSTGGLSKATLTGTTNQITVTNAGGSITLATPQSIATSSSPTFAGLSLGNGSLNTVGNIEIEPSAVRDITVGRSTSGAGNNLTIQAGGALSGATDTSGGTLILSSGISTGSVRAGIQFNTASSGSAGTTDNTPAARAVLFSSSNGVIFSVTSVTNSTTGLVVSGNAYALGGTGAGAFQQYRHTTTNTAGNSLSVISGGATSGATDKAAGDLVLRTGLSTGTGGSNVRIQTMTRALSTGTSDNTATDRIIATSPKSVTNNSATTLATLTLASGSIVAGIIHYAVEVTDGTDYQIEEGVVSYHATNKAGTIANNTTVKSANQQAATAGTLTCTFTVTSAASPLIQLNANSSLTPSTGYPRVTYTLTNLTQQAIAIS
jgi:collagen type VII alpha